MRSPLLFVFLLFSLVGTLFISNRRVVASDLGTITLLGQWSAPGANAGFISDVWGYVSSSNREYALVGSRLGTNGFFIIDVTNPTNPVQTAQATGSVGFDVKSRGQYVYTVTGAAGTGGTIFDLSSIFLPTIVGTFESSHNLFIDDRGYMYLSAAGIIRELRIYDLNPNPIIPGPIVWNDDIGSDHDVSVVGTMLYDFHGAMGTFVYDVVDPSLPILLGTITDSAIVYHHSGYPTEDGKYLFICDELAEHPTSDITVWNIENMANPFKVADIVDSISTVHNLYIVGDYAYVSYYASGFRVYDIKDPTNPQLADEFDTSGWEQEGFLGAFGVYPFTPSGNIYISDIDNGLYVFDFATASAVTFAFFDAQYADGAVRLSWGIEHADGLEAFHVYRSRSADGGFERLGPGLVPESEEYEDDTVQPGETYWYRLGAIDRDGEFLSTVKKVTIPDAELFLAQNVPNPFNPSTVISYEISSAGLVSLVIYNAQGQRIRTLVRESQNPGVQSAVWDGRDDAGRAVSSGVYFYQLSLDGVSESRQMLLLK